MYIVFAGKLSQILGILVFPCDWNWQHEYTSTACK